MVTPGERGVPRWSFYRQGRVAGNQVGFRLGSLRFGAVFFYLGLDFPFIMFHTCLTPSVLLISLSLSLSLFHGSTLAHARVRAHTSDPCGSVNLCGLVGLYNSADFS